MKTRYISAAAIALTFLAACNKEAAPVTALHLRAGIEKPSATRVSIGLDGKAQWNTDDLIAVHIGDAFVPIRIENPETGDFTIDTETYYIAAMRCAANGKLRRIFPACRANCRS